MARIQGTGRVLGGYADEPWASPEEQTCVDSTDAFVYLLRAGGEENGPNREKLRVLANHSNYALVHRKIFGPWWNGGMVIHKRSGRHWAAHGVYYQSLASGETLAGGEYGRFDMADWEVFRVMN